MKPLCTMHKARGVERPAEVTADYHPVGGPNRGRVHLCWPCSEDRGLFVNVRKL